MMSMDNGRQEQVSVAVPERSEGTATEARRPDPEVPEKAKRRRFTARYKLRVLQEAEACRERVSSEHCCGREGLYSSHLAQWRRTWRSEGIGSVNGYIGRTTGTTQ